MKTSCAVLFALLTAPFALPLPASAYDRIYAFGDSLSDDGNLYALTGNLYPPLPYFEGRLSNGITAVEYLADTLGAGLSNFAVAGARTGTPVGGGSDNFIDDDDSLFPPNFFNGTGVVAQVNSYLGASGGTASASGLYFIWAGPNDYFLLSEATPGSVDPQDYVTNAIGNLYSSVTTLYAAGAKNFLIPNLPNLGLVPELADDDPFISLVATQISLGHNAALADLLANLDAALPDASFFTADTFALTTAVNADPQAFGFTNATDACVESVSCVDGNGAGYLFWDGVHITTAAHQQVAAAFASALAPVPEAQTWAMLLAGLGLIGVAGRLRASRVRAHTGALREAT